MKGREMICRVVLLPAEPENAWSVNIKLSNQDLLKKLADLVFVFVEDIERKLIALEAMFMFFTVCRRTCCENEPLLQFIPLNLG